MFFPSPLATIHPRLIIFTTDFGFYEIDGLVYLNNNITIKIFRQIYPTTVNNIQPFTFLSGQFLFIEIKHSFYDKFLSEKQMIERTIRNLMKNLDYIWTRTLDDTTSPHSYILLFNGFDYLNTQDTILDVINELRDPNNCWFFDNFKVFWFNGAAASLVLEEKERTMRINAEENARTRIAEENERTRIAEENAIIEKNLRTEAEENAIMEKNLRTELEKKNQQLEEKLKESENSKNINENEYEEFLAWKKQKNDK